MVVALRMGSAISSSSLCEAFLHLQCKPYDAHLTTDLEGRIKGVRRQGQCAMMGNLR